MRCSHLFSSVMKLVVSSLVAAAAAGTPHLHSAIDAASFATSKLDIPYSSVSSKSSTNSMVSKSPQSGYTPVAPAEFDSSDDEDSTELVETDETELQSLSSTGKKTPEPTFELPKPATPKAATPAATPAGSKSKGSSKSGSAQTGPASSKSSLKGSKLSQTSKSGSSSKSGQPASQSPKSAPVTIPESEKDESTPTIPKPSSKMSKHSKSPKSSQSKIASQSITKPSSKKSSMSGSNSKSGGSAPLIQSSSSSRAYFRRGRAKTPSIAQLPPMSSWMRLSRSRSNLVTPDFVLTVFPSKNMRAEADGHAIPMKMLFDTGSSDSWVHTAAACGRPGCYHVGESQGYDVSKPKQVVYRHKTLVLSQFVKETMFAGIDVKIPTVLWLNYAKHSWYGDYAGVLGASPKTALGQSPFALVPQGKSMVYYPAPCSQLPVLACRSGRFHSVKLTANGLAGGQWQVEGVVTMVGSKLGVKQGFHLATGVITMDLPTEVFDKFTQQLEAKHMTIQGETKQGMLLVTECGADADSKLPILEVHLGGLVSKIRPRDYVYFDARLPEGSCFLAVRKQQSKVAVLGAPFLRNVVSVFNKDKVDMCVPKRKPVVLPVA